MTRRVRLRSLAKLNLDLRVLNKRAEGFHELRTVFQTISLADTIAIEFEAGRRTVVEIDAVARGQALDIPNNLIVRAANLVLDALKVKARVRFHLDKHIPMGGGLGGGSSNAAAVLLALPVLAGKKLSYESMIEMGAALGSDVPFFLEGGTALAVGRGTEIYALPDIAEEVALVIAPGIHVATAGAYEALGRGTEGGGGSGDATPEIARGNIARRHKDAELRLNPRADATGQWRKASSRGGGALGAKLTSTDLSRSINNFQGFVRALRETRSAKAASAFSANDFEPAVFGQYPQLKTLAARLRKIAGGEATGARMTGSGSALFAIFGSRAERDEVQKLVEKWVDGSLKKDKVLGECRVMPANLVSRRSYQRMWRKQLAGHVISDDSLWPPQSRHAG